MRVGLQVSADRGRYATKVEKLQADARWADEAGFDTVWTPQIPDEFDVMAAATLIGAATSRIEVGTSIVPVQPRHPVVLAQQALSAQAVCEGRFTLGLGVSHHWIIQDMLGLPYERQATTMRCYLDVLDQALAGPGLVEVENELFTIRQPLDITDITPTPVMIAALGPVMLQARGRACRGHRPLAGRRAHDRLPRRADHHRRQPRRRAVPPRASWPACRCASARRRDRRGDRADEQDAQRGGRLAQLRAA